MTDRAICATCGQRIKRERWDRTWVSAGIYPLCTGVYPATPHKPVKVYPEGHDTPAPVSAPSEAYVVTLPGETPRRFSTRLRALAYLLRITS